MHEPNTSNQTLPNDNRPTANSPAPSFIATRPDDTRQAAISRDTPGHVEEANQEFSQKPEFEFNNVPESPLVIPDPVGNDDLIRPTGTSRHDLSGQVMPHRDDARPDAAQHDMSRQGQDWNDTLANGYLSQEPAIEHSTDDQKPAGAVAQQNARFSSEKITISETDGVATVEQSQIGLDQSHSETATQAEPEEEWLDIEQTEALLAELGVSRTTRTVQRFCRKGKLDAKLVPTENGSRYIVRKGSIESFAARMKDVLPGNGFRSSEPLQDEPRKHSESNSRSSADPQVQSDMPSDHRQSDHMQQIVELKDQQIHLLKSQLDNANRQNVVKDEQITTMLERDHETNILIQNLQRMIGLPEAHHSGDNNDRANSQAPAFQVR